MNRDRLIPASIIAVLSVLLFSVSGGYANGLLLGEYHTEIGPVELLFGSQDSSQVDPSHKFEKQSSKFLLSGIEILNLCQIKFQIPTIPIRLNSPFSISSKAPRSPPLF